MAIERLTAEDEVMLWPDEIWPQDIGALAMFDGTTLLDDDGRFRIEAVREAVAGRLHLVPRFRQLLVVPPRRLGRPYWVDAPSFDLGDHVRVHPVPVSGDEDQLLLAVEDLRRRRLDRSRPLWEMWFLTGLPGRRVGWFVRLHHTMADGMAGVATIARFLDPSPNAVAGPARPWTPARAPTPADLAAANLREHVGGLGRALSEITHPSRNVRVGLAAWTAIRELLAARPLPATSLNRVVGPGRTLALIRSRLDLVKTVAHAHHATVNDVLLEVTAGGLRRLLSSRNEPVEGVILRMYVPVSLHRGARADARGNRISQMVVPLPLSAMDPGRRLRLIAAATARRKASPRPSLGKLPQRGLAGRAFLKLVSRQRVNVTSTNIPGPEVPLYLAGARLLEVFPLEQLLGTVSLAVGAMSYAGQFNLMVLADRDAYPDIGIFAAGVRDELNALAASVASSRIVA